MQNQNATTYKEGLHLGTSSLTDNISSKAYNSRSNIERTCEKDQGPSSIKKGPSMWETHKHEFQTHGPTLLVSFSPLGPEQLLH